MPGRLLLGFSKLTDPRDYVLIIAIVILIVITDIFATTIEIAAIKTAITITNVAGSTLLLKGAADVGRASCIR